MLLEECKYVVKEKRFVSILLNDIESSSDFDRENSDEKKNSDKESSDEENSDEQN